MRCVLGYRSSDWDSYLSEWGTYQKQNNVPSRELCWSKARENVPAAVGIFWGFDDGWCRAIDNLAALGTFESEYPDDKDEYMLCLFEQGTQIPEL